MNALATHEKILVTATEAAQLLSMGRSTFFENVKINAVPAPVEIGASKRWRVEDLRQIGRQSSRPTT